MGIAGAGFGAAKGLEQILAEQFAQAQLRAREREAQSRTQLEQQRLNETIRQNDINNDQQQQGLDMQAGDRRQKANIVGVRRMLGEALTQGQGPVTSQDRRGLAALQVESGDNPTLLNEPKVERDPIADFEAQEKIRAKYRPKPVGATAPPEQVFVTRNGVPVPIAKGTAQPGDVPYDPVAARSSKPANEKEAEDTAAEARRLATALRDHKGFGGVFGLAGSYIPTMRQDTADAEQLLGSLTGMLTLENMDKMKGVLSDSDMKVVRQASTTLNQRMSDPAARNELNRLVEVLGRVGGGARTAPSGADDPVDALILKYSKKKP